MNEGDDLLGKADALLGRYRGSSAPDFPVLTDVVEQPHPEMSQGKRPVDKQGDLRDLDDAIASELQDIEARLIEQVLSTVEPCIADLVGAQLREQIRIRLDSSLTSLGDEIAEDIRSQLAELVRNAVSVAIQREISTIRARAERY